VVLAMNQKADGIWRISSRGVFCKSPNTGDYEVHAWSWNLRAHNIEHQSDGLIEFVA
jgi:hypothetical protein